MRRTLAALTSLAVAAGTPLLAQHAPAQANDAGPSLDAAAKQLGWNEPTAPTRVVGPIHYVGVLTGHAHVDHVGGLAYLKRITGAQLVALDAEVDLLQSGGKTDFNYGTVAEFQFEPVTVDRVIRDGDKVTLGDVTLMAFKTAGHTRGSTTWVTQVTDGARSYTVVFPDGTSVNPGYRLVKTPSYPDIADDHRRTFQTLAALDPDGYRTWVDLQRQKFEAAVAKESKPTADTAAPRAVTVR